MTDLAFGAVCGLPSGLALAVDSARAIPSRNNMAPSAKPVKPMPVSARKERRVTPGQPGLDECIRSRIAHSLCSAVGSLASQNLVENLHSLGARRLPEPIQMKPEPWNNFAVQLSLPWTDFPVLAVGTQSEQSH